MQNGAGVVDIVRYTSIAQLDGLRLHYLQAGIGEALVLLHGFPETSYAWRKVMPLLAEHYRVIAPDLRGCGDTDRPAGGYDKRTVAADVYALMQQLKIESVSMVGHDVGMMVAYAYARPTEKVWQSWS